MATVEMIEGSVFWDQDWIGDGRVAYRRSALDKKRLHKEILIRMADDEPGSDQPDDDLKSLYALMNKIESQIENYSTCDVLPITYEEGKRSYLILSLTGALYFIDKGFEVKKNATYLARDNSLGLTASDGRLDLNAVICSSDGGETIDAIIKPAQITQAIVDALARALIDRKSAVVG